MDHGLRGTRIGAHHVFGSYNGDVEERAVCTFRCEAGHETSVPFAASAELPQHWTCRICGEEATRVEGTTPVTSDEDAHANHRTHWDMLLERRSRDELEIILQERLDYLHDRRAQAFAEMKKG